MRTAGSTSHTRSTTPTHTFADDRCVDCGMHRDWPGARDRCPAPTARTLRLRDRTDEIARTSARRRYQRRAVFA